MTTQPLEIIVTKPSWRKREYIFDSGNRQPGKMTFTKNFKFVADFEIADQAWNFSQAGFWKSFLTYKGSHRPYDKGILQLTWKSRMIFESQDKKKYTFRKTKWYSGNWGWFDEDDQMFISLSSHHSFSGKQATVVLNKPSNPDVWLMTGIAFFVYAYQKRQAAVAAST